MPELFYYCLASIRLCLHVRQPHRKDGMALRFYVAAALDFMLPFFTIARFFNDERRIVVRETLDLHTKRCRKAFDFSLVLQNLQISIRHPFIHLF